MSRPINIIPQFKRYRPRSEFIWRRADMSKRMGKSQESIAYEAITWAAEHTKIVIHKNAKGQETLSVLIGIDVARPVAMVSVPVWKVARAIKKREQQQEIAA